MRKIVVLILMMNLLIACKSSLQKEASNEQQVEQTLNDWHKAASNAKFDDFFALMIKNGVYIGTDATENWQYEAFREFAKPHFDKGQAWSFKPLERHVYFNKKQNVAWFDELLDTQMKICRGSGVLIKEKGKWKIAHYVLSMTVPNDKASEVIKIKSEEEDLLIQKLKK